LQKEKKSKDKKKRKDRKREKHGHKHKHRKADRERDGSSAAAATLRETASGASWGKYGILREGDMYSKQEEFLAWLSEVKGVPQDACGQRELKEHFADFCEDFNTATMPSSKCAIRATHTATRPTPAQLFDLVAPAQVLQPGKMVRGGAATARRRGRAANGGTKHV
jgi:hypothetical protein